MRASQPLCSPHAQASPPTPGSTPGPATGPTLVPTEPPPQGDHTPLVISSPGRKGVVSTLCPDPGISQVSATGPGSCPARPQRAVGGPTQTGVRAEGSQAVHMRRGGGGGHSEGSLLGRVHGNSRASGHVPLVGSHGLTDMALQVSLLRTHATLSRRTCSSLQ